mmetsp:Transcript_37429/g.77641  ORF Transcript_37429/g.77641 Transcript_37429/m.77641 type:complete len:410 (-) Transcript_37429:1486-2715(-)
MHSLPRLIVTLVVLLLLATSAAAVPSQDLCVVGCTPYVDQSKPFHGMEKFRALAADMATSDCAIIVHLGDTKPGKTMGCNATTMTTAVHILAQEGAPILLYAPGDNEINDCHRLQSNPHDQYPTEFVKASDARQFLVQDLQLNSGFDVTGNVPVISHNRLNQVDNPATCNDQGQDCQATYSCDFDKYIAMEDYAVATLEVIGSHWYLDDERNAGYTDQDLVDPLKDRLAMYVNAKDCALDWIEYSAEQANATDKRALFFMLHASFYDKYGSRPLGSGSIGEYYSPDVLRNFTVAWKDPVRRPYRPLFRKFEQIALRYPNLQFQIVHSDAHRWFQTRFNPYLNNHGNAKQVQSHHNMMIHQTEGASRALTTYTRFSVNPLKFQPISTQEEWSPSAFDIEPKGHAWIPYQP